MNKKTEELKVRSSIDGSLEKSFLFAPFSDGPRPLIIGLHSWSFDRNNQLDGIVPLAESFGFNALFPEFRGPNLASNTRAEQACASRLAMRDIIDAAEAVKTRGIVSGGEIYLLGGSGGAHMALMMAGYRPEYWKAVIASCPITDLRQWHGENPDYAMHIEACCGGPPEDSERIREYALRSPASYAASIAKATVYILHGKHDGCVPSTHSLKLFKMICEISPRASAYLEIFDGGHEQRLERVSEIIAGLSGKSGAGKGV